MTESNPSQYFSVMKIQVPFALLSLLSNLGVIDAGDDALLAACATQPNLNNQTITPDDIYCPDHAKKGDN